MAQKRLRPGALPDSVHRPSPNFRVAASSEAQNTRPDFIVQERLRRDAERLCELGARTIFELLLELRRDAADPIAFDAVIARFAGIDIDALKVAAGDRFPTSPIRVVST